MANHKSSIKRIRQTNARRLHNRYYAKTMRNAVRRFRALTDAAEARAALPQLSSMLDRLAGKAVTFYDLFRVEGGKIAEHWDVVEPVLPTDQHQNQNGKFGF